MKVVFIGFADVVHPWYDDFLEGIGVEQAVESSFRVAQGLPPLYQVTSAD